MTKQTNPCLQCSHSERGKIDAKQLTNEHCVCPVGVSDGEKNRKEERAWCERTAVVNRIVIAYRASSRVSVGAVAVGSGR